MELEECCQGLESTKVTKRSKSIKQILPLLQNQNTLQSINKDQITCTWDRIISSTYICLKHDADKYVEDLKKKKKKKKTNTVAHERNGTTFFDVVAIVIKEGVDIDFPKLFSYIKVFLDQKIMKQLYGKACLMTLKEHILLSPKFRSHLEKDDWKELLVMFKKLAENQQSLTDNNYTQVECLALLIKWCPLYKLSPDILREEFDFVIQICKSVNQSSLRPHKEIILNLAHDFCIHTAKDNRFASCKLGEEMFLDFLDLYEINVREDKLKIQLIDFFLLQVVLHHPKGVNESHSAAYANNWKYWNSCLRFLYCKLCEELNYNMKCRNKNAILFLNKNIHQEMCDNLIQLFIEVARQVLNKVDTDVSTAASTSRLSERQAKRPKSEMRIKRLIDNIAQTKNWPWVQIIYSLLEIYPDMICKDDYLHLLGILSILQKECNDQMLRYHVYKCLTVMNDIELTIDISEKDTLPFWSTIGETTLKEVGLHLCNDVTENLLQRLISSGKIYQNQQILKVFSSSTCFTKSRIRSLYLYDQNFNFPRSENNKMKHKLIKSILDHQNLEKIDYLTYDLTAKVLINLVSKYWFSNEKLSLDDSSKLKRVYYDISNVYFETCFEDVSIATERIDKRSEQIQLPIIDNELNSFMFETLTNMTNCTMQFYNNDIEVTLKVALLIKNIISTLSFNKYSFDDNPRLFDALKKLIEHFTQKFKIFSTSDDDNILKKLISSLELFYSFLVETKDDSTIDTIINFIPCDLLKAFFDILNQNACKSYSGLSDFKFKFTLNTMKAISAYCFISSHKEVTQTQFRTFVTIIGYNFDNACDFEYALSKTILSEFAVSKPGTLSEEFLRMLLDFTKNIYQVRFYLYDSTVDILEALKFILMHLSLIYSETCLNYVMNILEPLYEKRDNYGPQVSILIIECCDILCHIDSKFDLNRKWLNDELIIVTLSNFLCSDFQEIRLTAIKSIAKFFASHKLEIIDVQKEAFKRIFDCSLQVFELQGIFNRERQIDETVTRSASALQTFANIALSSEIWLQESLFSLIRITHMKKLRGADKVISLIARHLKVDRDKLILENLEYILYRWDNFKYSLDSFPFDLCECESKIEFCVKYTEIVSKFLIKHDDTTLNLVAQSLGRNSKDIVEDCCPKVFSDCICEEGATNMEILLNQNSIISCLTKKLGPDLIKLTIRNNMDIIISHLAQKIRDENDFKYHFNEAPIFSVFYVSSLTVSQFDECLKYIQKDFCQTDDIFEYLIKNEPYKINKITLELKLKLAETKTEKLRILHSYYIIVSLVTRCLNKRSGFHEYFIHDTVKYLLNLMENCENDIKLSIVSSHAFYKFITQILPDFSDSILPFFHIVINKLNNLSIRFLDVPKMSNCCINILKVIIVEHSDKFSLNIKMLDPFPSDSQFEDLQKVYLQVRPENELVSLEEDLENFLKCGYETKFSDFREEGLKHLCIQLSTRKDELLNLYKKLEETRGFSENSEKSLLHQIVCMLMKLATSKNTNVAIEACRCLGELGPANLSTLILQPERAIKAESTQPSEILIGQIISHLLSYTNDRNIKLVISATEILYSVLNTKEGRIIVKSDREFVNGRINFNHLIPFKLPSTQRINIQGRIDGSALITKVGNENLWCPVEKTTHNDWIIKLVCSFLEVFPQTSFLPKLIPVCKLAAEFCEEILPYLLHLVLVNTKNDSNAFIYEKIGYFFRKHWESSVENICTDVDTIEMNKSSVRCMLNCVHYIRLQINYSGIQKSPKDGLNLHYLHLAQAAQYCMQHFTAILYAELWCQLKYYQIIDSFHKEQSSFFSRSKMLDIIYENIDSRKGRALENILRNSYKTIGEFDALHGCGTSLFLDPSRRIEHYEDLGRWDQALLYHEIDVSNNKVGAMGQLMDCLKHCSLYKLPILINQSEEYEYECSWRLSQWNIDEDKQNNNNFISNNHNNMFEKYRYFSLRYLHDNDFHHLRDVIEKGRLSEIEKVKHTSLESCRNIYTILSHLQSLREIETFAVMKNDSRGITQVLNNWKLQDNIMNNNFDYIEPIKMQRIIMLSDDSRSTGHSNKLVDLSLDLAEYARMEDHLVVATRTMSNLRFYQNLTAEEKYRIQFEDAQLCWSLQDTTSAHHILRQLCNNEEVCPHIRSCALKLAGKWFIESLSENKNIIIENYLLESSKVYEKIDRNERTREDIDNIHDTYDLLGRYADREYQHIVEHMNSDVFQQKIKNMKRQKQAASDLENNAGDRGLTEDEFDAAQMHKRQSLIDEIEIENAEKEKNMLLRFALKYFLLNLINSDKNNIRIFRVISLFFKNRQNSSIKDIIDEYIPSLPTYKYITILPQIVPHLSDSNENLFVEHINQVILKCIKDHPHHTLPLILNLVYAYEDRQYTNSTASTSTNEWRVSSASKMIEKVKENDGKLCDVITKMEFLSEALIQLAYYTAEPKEVDIPHAYKIRKIKNYSNVLLPTVTLPVDKTCRYDNLIGIDCFSSEYHDVGGINTPKRITCRGTDGIVRMQLVKGKDDLRQDAVMQQVFTIMNSLLFTNKYTKNLIIRTYKIVPLSMRSGILEWVNNSMTLKEYLVGNEEKNIMGAHVKYRPNDKTPGECRDLMKNSERCSVQEKLKVYNEICKSLKPIFHKFFEYSFLQPSLWYERRRAYNHSVATASMCGYILGIGDRHVSNILIDKSTAEVIHVDFGRAFEQGRVQSTPETVPFRLTRDIVDGMGVCGVEGIFHKSCERTMEVMRQNSETVLAILEILLYDPLYTWAVTTAEAKKRQKNNQNENEVYIDNEANGDNVSVNITAERALMRVKSKLHGTEDGYPISLEHQVGALIQQAQDPSNLCRLYHGWQPYL